MVILIDEGNQYYYIILSVDRNEFQEQNLRFRYWSIQLIHIAKKKDDPVLAVVQG